MRENTSPQFSSVVNVNWPPSHVWPWSLPVLRHTRPGQATPWPRQHIKTCQTGKYLKIPATTEHQPSTKWQPFILSYKIRFTVIAHSHLYRPDALIAARQICSLIHSIFYRFFKIFLSSPFLFEIRINDTSVEISELRLTCDIHHSRMCCPAPRLRVTHILRNAAPLTAHSPHSPHSHPGSGESCYVTRLQSPAHTDWRGPLTEAPHYRSHIYQYQVKNTWEL